jgi:NADH-quinone oxidoreductase subunit A
LDQLTDHALLIWPLAVYGLAVIILVSVMLGLSYVLGQRHKDRATGEPFESGIVSTGSANLRFSVHYYLVAMFFVIFDLEVVFIVTWAIAFSELGWPAYFAVLVFILILVAALVYEWKIGALDYGTSGKKILKEFQRLNREIDIP